MSPRVRLAVKSGLLLLGVLLLVHAVWAGGPAAVASVASHSLPFVPLVALFSGLFFVTESYSQLSMLGEAGKDVPRSVFLKATLSSFLASTLLPLGRAGSEAMRIAAYAPFVGAPQASAASATFQVAVLLAAGIYSGVCALLIGLPSGELSLVVGALAVHSTVSIALGGLLLLIAQKGQLAGRMARLLPWLSAGAASFDGAAALPLSSFVRATGWCLAARLFEIGQYAVVLWAVGMSVSLSTSMAAAAIHILGATVGEAIPNQLGVVEAGFEYFSDVLGLSHDAAKAVAMPLLVRVGHLLLAMTSLLGLALQRRTTPAPELAQDASTSTAVGVSHE